MASLASIFAAILFPCSADLPSHLAARRRFAFKPQSPFAYHWPRLHCALSSPRIAARRIHKTPSCCESL